MHERSAHEYMYLKVLFFTCYNNIILIAIETHLLNFLKECINAIQRFWALQHVWSTIFQPRKAMVLLCALSLATHVASLLRSTAKTEAGLHDIAEAIEVMKEILTQISVNPSYKDHAAAASFCHCCLYTLRGVLLEWNTSTDAVQILPLAKMPKIGQNSVWTVVHPNRVMFLTEIQSSLRFLSLHSQAFEGEPWLWLVDFLETLEYHLAV